MISEQPDRRMRLSLQTAIAAYPPALAALPLGSVTEGVYRVRYAATPEELEEVLRLRFAVFNLELGEGLESSFTSGLDQDEFDPHCHHLLVEHLPSGRIIGTYRIQTSQMAAAARGFYTATEFDLSHLPAHVVAGAVEVGRACIEPEHRLKPVLYLLWKGLALYMTHNDKRFLFGPCSLTSQDPWDGKRTLDYLEREGLIDHGIEVGVVSGFECEWRGEDPQPEKAAGLKLPPLFAMYLRYAGRVCGPPVIDRRFKTIDFFVLFDLQQLSPRAHRMFFG